MSQKVTNTVCNIPNFSGMTDQTGIQGTVRIDKLVKETGENWIKTPEAKMKGIYSMSDLVTKAVREFLKNNMTEPEQPSHFILPNTKNHSLTIDFDVYLDKIHCNMCDSDTCIHIQLASTDKQVKKYLKEHIEKKNLKNQNSS